MDHHHDDDDDDNIGSFGLPSLSSSSTRRTTPTTTTSSSSSSRHRHMPPPPPPSIAAKKRRRSTSSSSSSSRAAAARNIPSMSYSSVRHVATMTTTTTKTDDRRHVVVGGGGGFRHRDEDGGIEQGVGGGDGRPAGKNGKRASTDEVEEVDDDDDDDGRGADVPSPDDAIVASSITPDDHDDHHDENRPARRRTRDDERDSDDDASRLRLRRRRLVGRHNNRPPSSIESRLLMGESASGIGILSLLLRRSMLPSPHSSSSSSSFYSSSFVTDHLRRFVDRGRHWNVSRSVYLSVLSDDDENENNNENNNDRGRGGRGGRGVEIRTMSFDREGILLATGDDDGVVRVYDFDDVRAADVKGRNGISRMESSWSSSLFVRPKKKRRREHKRKRKRLRLRQQTNSTTTTTMRDAGEEDAAAGGDAGEYGDFDECDDDDVDDDASIDSTGDGCDVDDDDDGGSGETGLVRPPSPIGPPLPAAASVRPVLSFRCAAGPNARGGEGAGRSPRIGGVLWSPHDQDRLVVYFTNRRELRVYDVASGDHPPPFVRLGDENPRMRAEGTTRALFMPTTTSSGRRVPAAAAAATRIIAGGDRGTVRMWTIPDTFRTGRRRTEGRTSSSVGAQVSPRCAWSFEAFRTEGVCDMLTLGSNDDDDDDGRVERPTMMTTTTTSSSHPSTKSLVLLAGDGSSLVLLDADRCTRKAFSTTITPTVVASWDLHPLMSRELSKVDVEAILPARRWTAAHGLRLLRRECTDRHTLFEVGIVTRCGWMLVAEFSVPRVVVAAAVGPVDANPTQSSGPSVGLRLSILHRTPRIRCFNSSNEPLATLGGMALQFSLPEIPVPSAALRRGVIWLGDVKQIRYTMPSKDKYVLSEEHGISSSPNRGASSPGMFRHPGGGLILARFNERSSPSPDARGVDGGEKQMCEDACIHARLPLSGGSPLTLAAHPSGEWIVIGYGMNGRGGAATKQIELASLSKLPAWRRSMPWP